MPACPFPLSIEIGSLGAINLNTRIILVRHGESTSNLEGLVQGRGHQDQPELQSSLTDRGIAQAAATGKALLQLPIDRVLVSPLKRAQQTADQILQLRAAPLPLEIIEELYEINLPEWEGLSFSEIQRTNPDRYDCWHNQPHLLEMAGRFPVLDLFAQAQTLWQKILANHQGETILLVGHSGINRAIISTALGIQPDRYHGLSQGNGSISIVNVKADGTAQLESANLTQQHGQVLAPLRPGWSGPRILLVRHGETDWNREQRFQGQIDVPLNPNGITQAQKTAKFLQPIPFDRCFSSPLLRPKQTAEAIINDRDLELNLIADLQEISHGLWEGKLESEIEQEFPGELAHWQTQPANVQMPQGENLQQVWTRAKSAWQEILQHSQPGETVLVVAHDAVNKALLCQLFDLAPDRFWAFKQGNGGVSIIDFREGINSAPVLTSCNITNHLSDSVLDTTAAGAL